MALHMNGRHRSLEADARQTPWESLDRDGTSENLFSGKRLLRETDNHGDLFCRKWKCCPLTQRDHLCPSSMRRLP
jgi:hypothetical protein